MTTEPVDAASIDLNHHRLHRDHSRCLWCFKIRLLREWSKELLELAKNRMDELDVQRLELISDCRAVMTELQNWDFSRFADLERRMRRLDAEGWRELEGFEAIKIIQRQADIMEKSHIFEDHCVWRTGDPILDQYAFVDEGFGKVPLFDFYPTHDGLPHVAGSRTLCEAIRKRHAELIRRTGYPLVPDSHCPACVEFERIHSA